MALFLEIDRFSEKHLGSVLSYPHEAFLPDPLNSSQLVVNPKYTVSWSDIRTVLTTGVCHFQNTIPDGPKCRGWGVDWNIAIGAILPSLLFFFVFLALRFLIRFPLIHYGYKYLGIASNFSPMDPRIPPLFDPVTKKLTISRRRYALLEKFQNQVWLTIFYLASTIFGYAVQRGKPWFTLPVNPVSAVYFHAPSPYNPEWNLVIYYYYAMGFYLSEAFSLIAEKSTRRADFWEYFLHHIVTLLLIFLSHSTWLHRFGVYILFIHDASDVLLSFTKALHYIVQSEDKRVKASSSREKQCLSTSPYQSSWVFRYVLTSSTVNAGFAGFVVLFVFFRLVCLPKMMLATVWLGVKLFRGNFAVWFLIGLLNIVLQLLHIYWGLLIVNMIRVILRGENRKDVRSDNDDTDEEEDAALAYNEEKKKLRGTEKAIGNSASARQTPLSRSREPTARKPKLASERSSSTLKRSRSRKINK